MKPNLFQFFTGFTVAMFSISSLSAMEGWMTDFEAARKNAAGEEKSF